MELISWCLLLLAGLAGLYYAQYMPNIFGAFAQQNEQSAADLKDVAAKLTRKTGRAFAVRRFCFVAGIVMLMFARGFTPLMRITALYVPSATGWPLCSGTEVGAQGR